MNAKIEGVILEKNVIEKEYDGKQVSKKIFMLFQRGEKLNAQVTVSDITFGKFKEGEKVVLNVRVNPYAFNGRAGMSIKEQEEV